MVLEVDLHRFRSLWQQVCRPIRLVVTPRRHFAYTHGHHRGPHGPQGVQKSQKLTGAQMKALVPAFHLRTSICRSRISTSRKTGSTFLIWPEMATSEGQKTPKTRVFWEASAAPANGWARPEVLPGNACDDFASIPLTLAAGLPVNRSRFASIALTLAAGVPTGPS